jgi:chemotaxis protein MotB
MSRGRSRGRRRGGAQHEESNERWLLTYADMITLLMALFMVLFSISSVNVSKYEVLQHSLKAAFSGAILPGGKSIAEQGATDNASKAPSSMQLQASVPVIAQNATTSSPSTASQIAQGTGSSAASAASEAAAAREASEFAQIKRELDAYAASHGFSKSVQTSIERRGLVIRVLTDDLLFESGQANLDPRADSLLAEIGQLLNIDETHPISVEGNTDNVPIHSSIYPSNWELSTARASTVVRFLIERGVSPARLTATGNADERPVDSNTTAAGRARNRRVEIVMRRTTGEESENEGESGSEP